MNKSKKENAASNTFAFTGGGTAGHVFPVFPVIDRIRRAGFNVIWIGSSRGLEKILVEGADIRYFGVPSGKFRRYFSFRNFTDLFAIIAGFFASLRILRREKPLALISKGGFVSVPPMAAARLLNIPILNHESDVDPGLAARLNFKLGARALVSYKKTLGYLPGKSRKEAVVTGNPVRDELFTGNPEEGRRMAGLKSTDERPLILVLGGSQGALEVNSLVTGCLESLQSVAAVVHQTGPGNPSVPDTDGYMSRPFFTTELPNLLAAADLAIARSGAGSVWELAATGTPAIFIPLRGATRGDQLLNASMAEEAGISVTLKKDSDSPALERMIKDLISDTQRRQSMGEAAGAYPAREAADRITEVLMEYAR